MCYRYAFRPHEGLKDMKILVINSGSSSIKYRFFNTRFSYPLCKGIVERIGSHDSAIVHHKKDARPIEQKIIATDHYKAMEYIFAILTSQEQGVVRSYKDISGVGHRVVHGAEDFTQPTIIDNKVIKVIDRLSDLAPLHNPPALLGIKACRQFAKNIPQVAVFDTAFHQTLPKEAYIYAIPYRFYEDLKIRRYGFHGTSHKFVARQTGSILKKSPKKLKLITCHLGNGCSITAVKNGKSIDTSMGFTPLEGLVMGTRCGDIDPAVVLYLMEKRSLGIKEVDDLLNKKSGLLGLSGVGNDMRDILKGIKSGKKRPKLALDIFLYRIKKYIGAYAALMNGLDAVALTAGIAENVPFVKKTIAKDLNSFLKSFNAKLLVVPTNEELLIASETERIISKQNKNTRG
jgi:acetate kinase